MENIPVSAEGEEPAAVVEERGSPEQPEEPAEPPPPESDAVATAARLLVGTASLGLEAFKARLRSLGGEEPRAGGATEPQGDPAASVTDTVVGAASKGVRAAYSLTEMGLGFARRGVQVAGGAAETVGRMVPGFVSDPVARVRRKAGDRLGELGAAGRDELARARQMARSLLDETLDTLIERLADDPAVREAIRTQSTSAVEGAVDDVRNRAAGMDDRIEGVVRRLLRREARPPAAPPS